MANQTLIEQALGNLVDNAIKYSGDGSDIVIGANRRADNVELFVRDNGPGIPEAHLGRIFERFYRVDQGRSRDLGGTGLGLSIVKHIALSHGGRVEVVSSPGTATTFSIFLPM